MSHAAATRGQDKEQHHERVMVPEEEGFDGWHALTYDACRWEDQGLWREDKAEGVGDESQRQRQSRHRITVAEMQGRQRRQLAQRLGQPCQRATAAEIQRRQHWQLAQRFGQPRQRPAIAEIQRCQRRQLAQRHGQPRQRRATALFIVSVAQCETCERPELAQ